MALDRAAGEDAPRPDPPRLTDGVVVLREEVPGDADAMTACLSEWATAQWLLSVPHPYVHQESLDWICQVAPEGWRTGSEFWLAIADASTDAFLGEIGIRLPEPMTRCGEIGYWMTPSGRGRGLMTRSLRLMVEWAFTSLGLVRIDWSACVGNEGSRRAAESVGFRLEGLRRKRAVRRSDGSRFDEWVGGLLRTEWLER